MKRIFILAGFFVILIAGANAQVITTKKVKIESKPVTAVGIDKKVSSTDSHYKGGAKKFDRKKLTTTVQKTAIHNKEK